MRKKKNNILKGMLAMIMALGLFIGEFPIVEAAETSESIIVDNSPVEFVDENGEVIAVFTPYSETNPAPDYSTRSTKINVNVSYEPYTRGHLSNKYTFYDGDQIGLNIKITPNAQSSIALYNHNTNTYGHPAGGDSATGWYGTLTVSGTGSYSMAFFNESAVKATYSGYYTLP